MGAKRALVVDDSRSARAFLARILERYALQVDSAESAEEALEYLKQKRPDVIFMDHLMPGMDGFQALTAIKSDPRTATIPIMMYTSQEGELYLSQARALGALGVLPKQTKPADVGRALEQLHLLEEERRPGDVAAGGGAHDYYQYGGISSATGIKAATALTATGGAAAGAEAAGSKGLSAEARAQIEALMREHALEMRRLVSTSLEKHSAHVVGELRGVLAEQQSIYRSDVPVPAAGSGRAVLWASALAAVVAIVAGALWLSAAREQDSLGVKVSTLGAQLAGVRVARPTPPAVSPPAGGAAADLASHAEPAVFVDSVPFGEVPLAGVRTDHVQAVLERLLASGFHGVVEVRSFPGKFCLAGSGEPISLASAESSYAHCDQIGNSQEGAAQAARESVAFANMLSALRSRSSGALDVQVGAGTAEEVAVPYPPVTEQLSAGEWNRAAAANNRLELRWHSAP